MDDAPDMMFCPSCGERIRRSARFCRHCGEPNRKRERGAWGPDRPPVEQSKRRPDRPASEQYGRRGDEARRQQRSGAEWEQAPPHRRAGREPGDGGASTVQDEGDETVHWRRALPVSSRRPDESALRAVGVAIGLGLLAMALLALFTVVGAVPASSLGVPMSAALLLGTVIGQYVGFLGFSLWYLRYRGLDWASVRDYLGVRMPTLKQLAMALGAWLVLLIGAMVIGLIAELAAELLGSGEPGQAEQDITRILAENPELVPLAIVMMFLVVGPCEEILFRGVIQGRLRERFSAKLAIGITAVFFGTLHVGGIGGSLQGIVLALSVLTLSGVVLGAVYEYTKNLVVVALLHGFHNSMVVLIVYANEVYDLESAILGPILQLLPF